MKRASRRESVWPLIIMWVCILAIVASIVVDATLGLHWGIR